ncbi:glycerophosphodiester phosphodiesterase [Spiractinospora alimapuensis]|uniref:glycerophosphodiester phosphodiesterase n=1 Tax=Spiractinospora alimapuensis TaxID=2820884 RepID=UPI001F2071E5|nr:glycerophosphodiester phosphodiesterase [Spiractinospora alimapuensis]QVQ52534.1 glycerophosphodiester phosphodiesterase [Spiractinospora alimapuensis]
MNRHFLDTPTPFGLAHRGGWVPDAGGQPNRALENTPAAFQHALDLGYTHLETDVRVTRDGEVLAFHDATLDRATDRSGVIAELTYSEVARARVGGGESVPRLEDLLGAWPSARFNIDVKEDRAVVPLADVLRRTGAWDRVCVGSFRQARLEAARRVMDRPVCVSGGPVDVARLRVAAWTGVRGLVRRGVDCVQIPLSHRGVPLVTRDLVATAHAAGLQVHVWTINDTTVMRRLLDAGVDAIVTDNTVGLRDVLRARGAWPDSDPSPSTEGRTP